MQIQEKFAPYVDSINKVDDGETINRFQLLVKERVLGQAAN